MKVKYRQTTKGGCGLYALANVFDAGDHFLEDLEALNNGQGSVQLNDALRKYSNEYYLGTVFCTQSAFKPPFNRLRSLEIFSFDKNAVTEQQYEELAQPYLISFKGQVQNHCVLAIFELNCDKVHVFDSLCEESLVLTKGEIIENYYIIEVLMFCGKAPGTSMYVDKSLFLIK